MSGSDCKQAYEVNDLRSKINRVLFRIKCWYAYRFKKSNYMIHFERELKVLRSTLEPEDNLLIEDYIPVIKQILKICAKQGHSGGSAPFNAQALSHTIKNTLLFKPLSPITGEDSEWNDVGREKDGEDSYQNNRCSAIFKKGKDGKPYYLDAIIWQGPDSFDTFTGTKGGITSRQNIKLPFTPKSFYINIMREPYDPDKHGEDGDRVDVTTCGPGDMAYWIEDWEQFNEVAKYYDVQSEILRKL